MWLQVQGCTKLESPICNPRSNGLSEQAVHTIKKTMRAWNSSLRVSFYALLQRVLFTNRKPSSVRQTTPSEVLPGRKMRLPAVINHPIGERVMFRAGHQTVSFVMYAIGRAIKQHASLRKIQTVLREQFSQVLTILLPLPIHLPLPMI